MVFYSPAQSTALQERLGVHRVEEDVDEVQECLVEPGPPGIDRPAVEFSAKPAAPRKLSTFEVELMDAWCQP